MVEIRFGIIFSFSLLRNASFVNSWCYSGLLGFLLITKALRPGIGMRKDANLTPGLKLASGSPSFLNSRDQTWNFHRQIHPLINRKTEIFLKMKKMTMRFYWKQAEKRNSTDFSVWKKSRCIFILHAITQDTWAYRQPSPKNKSQCGQPSAKT